MDIVLYHKHAQETKRQKGESQYLFFKKQTMKCSVFVCVCVCEDSCPGQITRGRLPASLCVWCQTDCEEVYRAPGSRTPTVHSHFAYALLSSSDLYIICIHYWGVINCAGKCPCPHPDLTVLRYLTASTPYIVPTLIKGFVFLHRKETRLWGTNDRKQWKQRFTGLQLHFTAVQFEETDVDVVTKWLCRCFQFGSWTAKLLSSHSRRTLALTCGTECSLFQQFQLIKPLFQTQIYWTFNFRDKVREQVGSFLPEESVIGI